MSRLFHGGLVGLAAQLENRLPLEHLDRERAAPPRERERQRRAAVAAEAHRDDRLVHLRGGVVRDEKEMMIMRR
jgi:hypothetical protein